MGGTCDGASGCSVWCGGGFAFCVLVSVSGVAGLGED